MVWCDSDLLESVSRLNFAIDDLEFEVKKLKETLANKEILLKELRRRKVERLEQLIEIRKPHINLFEKYSKQGDYDL